MAKRLSKVRFKGGELALRECDELGRVGYYTQSGKWLGDVKGLCKIIEELGTFNSEFEFRMLLSKRPAVYHTACDVCGQPVLVVVEEGGGSCRVCGFFTPDCVEGYQ